MDDKIELYKKAKQNAERLAVDRGERLNTAIDEIEALQREISFYRKQHGKNIVDVYLNHNKDIKLGSFLIEEEYSDSLLDILSFEQLKVGSAINADTNEVLYLSFLLSGDNKKGNTNE